jgi:glutathione S-transferase
MSLTIYGKPASRAFRVLWAAEELGLDYENVAHDFTGGAIKSPDYLAINPNGAIPAIVDDGAPLFESLAITLYLARKAKRLWPGTVGGEGLTFQWTLWAATEVEPAIGAWVYHTFALPEPERKPSLAADGAKKLESKLDVLDGVLAKRAWLADDAFTIADLNVASVLYRGPRFGLQRWPRVVDWHQRCYARTAAKRAVAMREAATT